VSSRGNSRQSILRSSNARAPMRMRSSWTPGRYAKLEYGIRKDYKGGTGRLGRRALAAPSDQRGARNARRARIRCRHRDCCSARRQDLQGAGPPQKSKYRAVRYFNVSASRSIDHKTARRRASLLAWILRCNEVCGAAALPGARYMNSLGCDQASQPSYGRGAHTPDNGLGLFFGSPRLRYNVFPRERSQ
jgi:hypothetical protein